MKNYEGVNFVDKEHTYIEDCVKIGKNVTIYPNNEIKGNTIIGDNVTIFSSNKITNAMIGDFTTLEFSHLQDCEIGCGCTIGPFARVRPNTKIGNNVKIGNFVEIKNSIIGDGAKASHLAYIGDAVVGKNCNIGCGVIFVNYNGKTKSKTIVENDCFIGSNVNLIAPLRVAHNTYVCAGSTLTVDTKPYDFVIARPKETIKTNYSKKYQKEE